MSEKRDEPKSTEGQDRSRSNVTLGEPLDDHSQYHGQKHNNNTGVFDGGEINDDITNEPYPVESGVAAEIGRMDDDAGIGQSALGEKDLEAANRTKAGISKGAKSERDPNLVTWEGPHDAENPRNWPLRRKWAAALVGTSFWYL
jgi:hypothetical protein